MNLSSDDPSDWSDAVPSILPQLDELLRCGICKEIVDTPLLLPGCGHSFCALCLRNYIRGEPHCPECRTPTEERSLVRDIRLDELARGFRAKRTALLTWAVSKGGDVSSPPISTTTTTTTTATTATTPEAKPRRYETRRKAPVPAVDAPVERVEECPACGVLIPGDGSIAERHVNLCLDGKEEEAKEVLRQVLPLASPFRQASAAPTAKPPRLARLVYQVMSAAQLRKKLEEHGLNTIGSKDQLVRRHQAFQLVYDANRDRASPRPIREVVRAFTRQERATEGAAMLSHPPPSASTEEHVLRYASEFEDLISRVRKRKLDPPSDTADQEDPPM